MSTPAPRSLIRRTLRCLGLLFVCLLGLLVSLFLIVEYRQETERAEWKTTTLAQLSSKGQTDPFVRSELVTLKADPTNDRLGSWAGDHVILMTNGEFLTYAFWHGQNAGYVDHLFLARASNGRWYYSTFHFCNLLAGIRADNPPSSIDDFVKKYSLREFDGKSDICLTHTWPE